jgi:outer membrane protein assembly factor BamD (BamD/ComL family)
MLGASYVQLGQLDLAEASLLRALAITPSVAKAHMQLYNVYMKRKMPDKALKEADTYLEQYPNAPDRDYVQAMAEKLRKALKPLP